jgi:hypothetical protein
MTRVADDVAGKLARQLHDVFHRVVYHGSLEPETAFRYIKQMIGNLLIVTIDISLDFMGMVEAGNYDSKYINPEFTPEDLPLFRNVDADREVNLRKQNEDTTTGQWLKILDENPESTEQFCHPFSLLAIGDESQHPDEQREAPIFTVWKSPRTGQLWCAFLFGFGRERYLNVHRPGLDDFWYASCRAAAVSKVSAPQAQ